MSKQIGGVVFKYLVRNLPIGDIWLNESEHLLSCLGHLDKNTIVDLEETQKLEDFSGLGGNFVDTTDANNEVYFGLSWDKEVTRCTSSTLESDLFSFLSKVFLGVCLSTLEDYFALCLLCLQKDVRLSE